MREQFADGKAISKKIMDERINRAMLENVLSHINYRKIVSYDQVADIKRQTRNIRKKMKSQTNHLE